MGTQEMERNHQRGKKAKVAMLNSPHGKKLRTASNQEEIEESSVQQSISN